MKVHVVFVLYDEEGEITRMAISVAATEEIAAELIDGAERAASELRDAYSLMMQDDMSGYDRESPTEKEAWDQYEEVLDEYNDMFCGNADRIAASDYFDAYYDSFTVVEK